MVRLSPAPESASLAKKEGWRCVDPTVLPHLVFDEASSWWSTENVVLPDSESLDTSMRAQLPEIGR